MGRALDQQDGLGLYSRTLLHYLLSMDPQTLYVILLSAPECADLFAGFANAETRVLPSRSKLLWDQVTVPRAARAAGADLIFNPKFSVPLLTRVPCIFVLHSADWYVNPQNYPWWDVLYSRVMLPVYCRKARRLLAISHATLSELAAHIPLLSKRQITVSYAAVGEHFRPPQDTAALECFRRDYALPPAFILTVARTYHSGHASAPAYPGGNTERLIRAHQRYRSLGGQLPLVVAGHRVERYLQERGFTSVDLADVRFIGFLPNDRMHLAYQSAECFVLATLCESFGLPILEALACGCPAIVPNTCASPEVAGAAARLIDPRDETSMAGALLEVAGSAELRAQMRASGLERARQFTWQETARRTLAAFDAVCAQAHHGRS
jgi:glycosyltransferase involved in cell wall biosynthesis